jgi:hypothetical protein
MPFYKEYLFANRCPFKERIGIIYYAKIYYMFNSKSHHSVSEIYKTAPIYVGKNLIVLNI